MNTIKFIEENFSDGEGKISRAMSSFHPQNEPPNLSHIRDREDEGDVSGGHFLPCHYFDYICGTSTGGLASLKVGQDKQLTKSQPDCDHALPTSNDCR
jgi:hypothetical protein